MAKAVQPFVVELKNQQLPLIKYFNKKILFTLIGSFALFAGHAQGLKYYNATAGTGDATILSNWTSDPAGGVGTAPPDFAEGDTFVIRKLTTVTSSVPWTISGTGLLTAALDIEGIYSPASSLNLSGPFINNGTFVNGGQTVTLASNGVNTDIDGDSATTFHVLTIDATGIGSNIIPIVTALPVTIDDGGTLNLTNGFLKVGSSGSLAFANAATINVNTGSSDFANSNDGTSFDADADGGTIDLNSTSGGIVTVNGNATFNNITTTAGGNGNVRLDLAGTGSLINGTLTIKGGQSDQFAVQGNSPIWGSASTLFLNNNGQAYTPGLEWVSMSSGNIGITPGYPNNVTLMNMGPTAAGFDPFGPWAINGVFSVGNGVVPGKATVSDMSIFVAGGIAITANSSLLGHNIIDKGNWSRSGVPIGTYTDVGGGTVTFSGLGTPASPQAISVSSGSETSFANVSINNGTYVKLASTVTIPSTGSVSLISGLIETSAAHLLIVANTAVTGIMGGTTAAYINGPVQWSLAAGSSNTYVVPTGSGTSGGYLPFTITPNTPLNNVTFQGFKSNSGGTPDGTTLAVISHTEYWKMTTSTPLNPGSSVSLGRATPVSPYNRIGESATQAGVYTSVGGTANTFSIDNSNDIGTSSPFFFVLGDTTFLIPVRFVDVKALAQSNHTLVQWQVADQSGIADYAVLKSTDDIHFISIGQVPATASLSYNFTDASPAAGYNYYKIESVSNSGSTGLSDEASVLYGAANTSDAFIAISPNPVTGSSIGIKMSDVIPSGVYVVSLTNTAGQNVYNTSINHVAGNSTETITPTTPLEPGTYYLSLSGLSTTGTDRYSLKVIVVH